MRDHAWQEKNPMHTVMIRCAVFSCVFLSDLYILTHAAEQTITRIVEDFTLGMPKEQAFAVSLSGIKQHQLTLVDQAQTPSQALMERLEHTPQRRCRATMDRAAECGRPLYAQCPPL